MYAYGPRGSKRGNVMVGVCVYVVYIVAYVPGAMPQINMFVDLLHSGWLSLTLIAFSDKSLNAYKRVTHVNVYQYM